MNTTPGGSLASGTPGAGSFTSRRESITVLFLIATVFAINLLTGGRFPCVWMDEVQHTDPAANLYLGSGFTSSAWYVQTSDKFWAGSVPLHQGLLFLWMKVFGFNLLAVRAMNYALVAAATVLMWVAIRRHALVSSAGGRILFVALMLLGYGPSICARAGRYDGITILLTASAACAFAIPGTRSRLAILAGLGFLFPLAGLQLAAFAAVFSALLLLFTGWKWFRECAVLGLGIALGGGALWAFYSSHGVWQDFVATVRYSIRVVDGSIPKDPSLFALLLPALLLTGWLQLRDELRLRLPLTFGVVAAIGIPVGMKLVGRFPTYYSWMAYVPLAVGVSAAAAENFTRFKLPLRLGLILLLALPCVAGLPIQLGSTIYFWQERDYARVEKLVTDSIRPGEWVYCDPEPYYAVKKRAARTFLNCYEAITPEENARITVVIVRPHHAPDAIARFGGNWVRSPQALPGITRPFLWSQPDTADKLIWDYHLEVWRKQPAAEAR